MTIANIVTKRFFRAVATRKGRQMIMTITVLSARHFNYLSKFGIFFIFLVSACKHVAKDSSTVATDRRVIFRDLRGYDDHFTKLVNSGDLKEGLKFSCKKFSLRCDHISISKSEDSRNRAVTYPYTNKIVLYPAAFEYLGMPHPGWLASIIEHENLHTRQSMYIRALVMGPQARIMGDRSYEAAIEYEAWENMLHTADKFDLTCSMIQEIRRQLYFYGKILSKNGRGPKDETDELDNYTMPSNEQNIVLKTCEREQALSK